MREGRKKKAGKGRKKKGKKTPCCKLFLIKNKSEQDVERRKEKKLGKKEETL